MRAFARLLGLLCLGLGPAYAEGERAGHFDYYVLSLSWSPAWCAEEGDARGSPQCARRAGWVVHGLWPQFEKGWPSFCRTAARDPSRRETAAMAEVMGDSGNAWHQWRKHGRCSGLSPQDYFATVRAARAGVKLPDVFTRIDRALRLPASVVEEAFLEANPDRTPDMLTITCRDGRIREVRLCLTRGLEPRRCGADMARDCALRDALIEPLREAPG